MAFLAKLDIVAGIASKGAIDNEQLSEVMNSSASSEEKTSFLIQYLLAQRESLLNFAKTLLFALLVFVVGRKLVKLGLKLTDRWMKKREVEVSVQKFVMSLANCTYNVLLIFVVAGILGIGTSSIVAMLGSAGLAIGLAFQGGLSNLAGGLLILLLKTFRVGDYIVVSDVEGTVESIDVFYTRISTTDNKIVVIPNGIISNSSITNTTKASERMLIIPFMIDYDTDIQKVREDILESLKKEPLLSKDKDMLVVADSLTPIKVKMQIKVWTQNADYWNARYRVVEILKEVLEKNDVRAVMGKLENDSCDKEKNQL